MPPAQRCLIWRCVAGATLFAAAASALAVAFWAGAAVPPQAPTTQPPTAQTAQRDPLVLLYDTLPNRNARERVGALGASSFYILYQSCDPQCSKSGVIDSEAVLKAIASETKDQTPAWGMLDFEEPFNADLQKGPDSPEGARAIATMIQTVRAVKARFPQTKWTYYGVPWLSYWLGSRGWMSATPLAKREALERAAAIYGALIKELDWVSPTVYPKYDPRLAAPDQRSTVADEGKAWRTAQVGLASLLAQGKPVIPTVAPYWTPGGKADFCRVVSAAELIDDQVAPSVAAGATGIAIWTAIDYFINISTDCTGTPVTKEDNFGAPEWRAAFVADYLDNKVPADWCDPTLKQRLLLNTSDTIAAALTRIRDWERAQSGLPK